MRYKCPRMLGLAAATAGPLFQCDRRPTRRPVWTSWGRISARPTCLAAEEVPLADHSPGARTPFSPRRCGDGERTILPRTRRPSAPSNDSEIRIEIWLPPPGSVERQVPVRSGNGGFAGVVIYPPDGLGCRGRLCRVEHGCGSRRRDERCPMGRRVTRKKSQTSVWRSVHETALASKALNRGLLRPRPPAPLLLHGLFERVGREGLIEAQRFPDGLRWHRRRRPRELLAGRRRRASSHTCSKCSRPPGNWFVAGRSWP